MVKLSSIHQNHLVLNCRCGHVGQISVQDLIEVYGGDVDVDAVERAARCSKCKGKNISSVQIQACKLFILGEVLMRCTWPIRQKTTKIVKKTDPFDKRIALCVPLWSHEIITKYPPATSAQKVVTRQIAKIFTPRNLWI